MNENNEVKQLRNLMESIDVTIEEDYVTKAVKPLNLKWIKGKEDNGPAIVTLLPDGTAFMIYYDKKDKSGVGWATGGLKNKKKRKSKNIVDNIMWDGSGTDDIEGAVYRLQTWIKSDGEQDGYDYEEPHQDYYDGGREDGSEDGSEDDYYHAGSFSDHRSA